MRGSSVEPVIVRVPGDKSISHRALILSALANGESRLQRVLPAEDPRSTAGVLRALGVAVPELPPDGGEIRVSGVGLRGLRTPAGVLDCGNSGTTARLLLGVLAGQGVRAVLDGDPSLRSRPMRRVTDPLSEMGARFDELGEPDRLPLSVEGGPLRPLKYTSPRASAQVKSALLLAGLTAGVEVRVSEPVLSRDHTERLLVAMGARIEQGGDGDPWVRLRPVASLRPLDLIVPGDPSSAAFFLVLAALLGRRPLEVRGVALNPARTGFLRVLRRMGVELAVETRSEAGGEPVGRLRLAPSRLRGTRVEAEEVPSLLDEIPALAVLAVRAEGETRITGAGELRVKETDRLRALASNLRGLAVEVEELEDGLVLQGTRKPLTGFARTWGDHRLAMAFGVLAAEPGSHIEVERPSLAAVSYPTFWQELARVRRELLGEAAR